MPAVSISDWLGAANYVAPSLAEKAAAAVGEWEEIYEHAKQALPV